LKWSNLENLGMLARAIPSSASGEPTDSCRAGSSNASIERESLPDGSEAEHEVAQNRSVHKKQVQCHAGLYHNDLFS
jgi:hypothetical protein